MRVVCRHGHFAFFPRNEAEVARWCQYFGQELVRERDFYTFPRLQDAPNYSIAGKLYCGTIAIKTYAGEPWEIMKANKFVYHIASDLLIPKIAVFTLINPKQTGFYFLAQSPLIQPGSRNSAGQQVLSFSGEFHQETYQLRLTEFSYD